MTTIDSRSALLHFELLNAIAFARRMSGGDTDGFLNALHEQGFMVVPIPPEFQPYEPVEQQNAAIPNATEPAPAPAPEPEFRMTNANASWDDWLRQARHLGENEKYIQPSDGQLRDAFDRGETPDEAVSIPF